MPNIAGVLKDEIRRLARRRSRPSGHHETSRGKVSQRHCQAEADIEPAGTGNQSPEEARGPAPRRGALETARYSARSVRAQRQRLGLSAADYGKLSGRQRPDGLQLGTREARPRQAQLAALVAVRGIGKREALRKLAEAAKKRRGSGSSIPILEGKFMAKKPGRQWTWAPSKMHKPTVPDDIKKELTTKAAKLVMEVLKPRYIKHRPRNPGGTTPPIFGRNGTAASFTSAPLGESWSPCDLADLRVPFRAYGNTSVIAVSPRLHAIYGPMVGDSYWANHRAVLETDW